MKTFFVNLGSDGTLVNLYKSDNESGYYSTIMNSVQSLIVSKVNFEILVDDLGETVTTTIIRSHE